MSDSFHISLSEFNKAEFDTAYQLFSGLADKGIAKAQINIGMMFEKRRGYTRLRKSSQIVSSCKVDQGLINAQYNLGLMYAYGKGVSQANKEAAKVVSTCYEAK